MKYILRNDNFYFTGFDKYNMAMWVKDSINGAKQYKMKVSADYDNERIFKIYHFKCAIEETSVPYFEKKNGFIYYGNINPWK